MEVSNRATRQPSDCHNKKKLKFNEFPQSPFMRYFLPANYFNYLQLRGHFDLPLQRRK